jgi:predicted methyltransferase
MRNNTMKNFSMKYFSFLLFISIFHVLAAKCQEFTAHEKYHNSLQPPEQVMDSLGVKAGMVVGEVGAGRGRYAVCMANRVGKTGMIMPMILMKMF